MMEEIIHCKDCRYQIKRFFADKRYKEGGYWDVGCEHFGEIMGYWGWGGQDDEFCSDAKPKEIEESESKKWAKEGISFRDGFIEGLEDNPQGYVLTVGKGKHVDFWIMDKPEPKEASVIFSCRFSRYVKPKGKPIMDLINEALIKGGTE